MKKESITLVFVLALFFSFVLVSSSFEYNSHSLQKKYRIGDTITGSINITLKNELGDSLLKSNLGGQMKLIDFILNNSLRQNVNYNCTSVQCKEQYSAKGAITSIELDGEQTVGFKIIGENIQDVDSLGFNVESDLLDVCNEPLRVDILGKGERILASSEYNDLACSSKSYGCFDAAAETGWVIIGGGAENKICENISVGPGPAYRVGARINKTGAAADLQMAMEKGNVEIGECMLPKNIEETEEVSCIINYSFSSETNFTLCIINSGGPEDYQILSEVEKPVCGNFESDFEMHAYPLEYNQKTIEINSEQFEKIYSGKLGDYIFKYLSEKYETNKDKGVICPTEGCIVPIKLTGTNQKLQFSNSNLKFKRGGLSVVGDAKIYELEKKTGEIEGNNLILDLSKLKFQIPLGVNGKNFTLTLGDKIVFEENISVEESFDFDINPKIIYMGLETKFLITSSYNLTLSTWNFGDNSTTKATTGKSVSYQYLKGGEFEIDVNVISKEGLKSSKKFKVNVGNAKVSSNWTLIEYKRRLSNLSSEINLLSQQIKTAITNITKLNEIKEAVNKVEKDFIDASSEENYSRIMLELLKMDVPYSVSVSEKGIIDMAGSLSNIRSDYVEEISGEDADNADILKESIINWYLKNYDVDIVFEVISSFSDNGKKDLLTRYSIKITPKEGAKEAFLFLSYPLKSINFASNYGEKPLNEGGGTYIPIKSTSKTIDFFVEESVDVSGIGAFISPEISELSITSNNGKPICKPGDKECQAVFPWTRLALWIGILVMATIIVYLLLQMWYKKNYENSLFKNKNDLFNLTNFVQNSRNAGLSDGDIKEKLKTAGWSGERIAYAFKKADKGGMNMQREMVKSNVGYTDTRFIKGQRF